MREPDLSKESLKILADADQLAERGSWESYKYWKHRLINSADSAYQIEYLIKQLVEILEL